MCLEVPHKKEASYLLFCFAVLSVATRIRLISRQSLISESPSASVMYSDITRSRSQYSVSAVSFNAICIFAMKSALLFPYAASLAFAPMDVPLRMICLEMIVSCFYLIRYWFSFMILAANFSDFSRRILACIYCASP